MFVKIFLSILTIPILINLFYGSDGKGVLRREEDKIKCPNQWKISKLRGEFVSILHLIEKQEIGQETGWKKFGKFLTFLEPKKRMETVDDFCAKINSERDPPTQRWFRKVRSSNYEECLDKIFWAGNAELVKLKPNFFTGLIYNTYTESAKMFEGMLKPREQLMAELFYAMLNSGGRAARQMDTDVLLELMLIPPMEELSAAIVKYSEMYKKRRTPTNNHMNETQLLVDVKNFCRKAAENSVSTKKTCKFVEGRIGAIVRNSGHNLQEIMDAIFQKCDDWAIWKKLCCIDNHCTNCGLPHFKAEQLVYAWHGEQIVLEIDKVNKLLRELLMHLKLDKIFEKNFATNFLKKCDPFIEYMHNPHLSRKHHQHLTPPKESPAKKGSWFRRSNANAKAVAEQQRVAEPMEIDARENFAHIEKMLQISGLYADDSQYKYLAQKLKKANLTGNYQTIQRIVDMHVGVDMLKILDHYAEGVAGVLKDSTTIAKNGRNATTTFNAMFSAAYLNILNNLSNRCYVFIEQEHLQPIVKKKDDKNVIKKVRFHVDKPKPETARHAEEEEIVKDASPPITPHHLIGEKLLHQPSPKKVHQSIDEEDELLHRLDNLMDSIRQTIEYISNNEQQPVDRGKGKAENCEVDDQLFAAFMGGLDIEHELLSRGGLSCLKLIYANLDQRRAQLFKKPRSGGSLKIGKPEEDNKTTRTVDNLKPIKTSKSPSNDGITNDNIPKRDILPDQLANDNAMNSSPKNSLPKKNSSPTRRVNNIPPKLRQFDPIISDNIQRNIVPKSNGSKVNNSPPKLRPIDPINNDNAPKRDVMSKSSSSPTRNVNNSPSKLRQIDPNSIDSKQRDTVPKSHILPTRNANNSPPKLRPIDPLRNSDNIQREIGQKSNILPTKTINSSPPKLHPIGPISNDNIQREQKSGILPTISVNNSPPKLHTIDPISSDNTQRAIVPKSNSSPTRNANNSPPKLPPIDPNSSDSVQRDIGQKSNGLPIQYTRDQLLNEEALNKKIDESGNSRNVLANDNPTNSRQIKTTNDSVAKSDNLHTDKHNSEDGPAAGVNERDKQENVLKELNKLIDLIRNARDNLAHAEVELDVPEIVPSVDIDCWVSDEQFKKFLWNGEKIGINLLPRGDANNMKRIYNDLVERRDYYLENSNANNPLVHRIDSLISRVDRAHKYLIKAEGPFYSQKTRPTNNSFVGFRADQLFDRFMEGKKISHKLLPKGGSACLEAILDNLFKRREILRHGGDGLLGVPQPQLIGAHIGQQAKKDKYRKSQSLPSDGGVGTTNGTKVPFFNEVDYYKKSTSMPTTGAEYERHSSERSRSYGSTRTVEEEEDNNSRKADNEGGETNKRTAPAAAGWTSPTWMDTARDWSGWMTKKLNNMYSWNKMEPAVAEQSLPSGAAAAEPTTTTTTTTAAKMGEQNSLNSSKNHRRNDDIENTTAKKHSARKNNNNATADDNHHIEEEIQQSPMNNGDDNDVYIVPTKRNKEKISPPQNPSTPGLAASQRPQITISPDSPSTNHQKPSPINGKSRRAHAAHSSDSMVMMANRGEKIVPTLTKSQSLDQQQNGKTEMGLTNASMAYDGDTEDDEDDNVHLLSTSRLGKITDHTMNNKHDVQLRPVVDRKGRKGRRRHNNGGANSSRKSSPAPPIRPPSPPSVPQAPRKN